MQTYKFNMHNQDLEAALKNSLLSYRLKKSGEKQPGATLSAPEAFRTTVQQALETSRVKRDIFEPQQGLNCGLHSVNSILKSQSIPVFTAETFRTVFRDVIERSVCIEDPWLRAATWETLWESAGGADPAASGWPGDALVAALHHCGLETEYLSSSFSAPGEASQILPQQRAGACAFIVNSGSHWYSFVRVDGKCWWNMDSLQDSPTRISDLELQRVVERYAWGGGGNKRGECVIEVKPAPFTAL